MTLRRRDLLRLTALGAAVPLLQACGGDGGDGEPSGPVALKDVGGDAAPTLQIGDAESELLAGSSRYAFGLRDEEGPVASREVTVHVGRDPDRPADATVAATPLVEEIGADRGLYVAEVAFPQPGEYFVAVVAELEGGTKVKGGTRVTVRDSSPSPAPGDRVPVIPTPTTQAPIGADPLCSRRPEPCSMHAVSLDDALRNAKPTVVVFAAPAFCRTELCGPSVEIVDRIAAEKRDAANFIHVEAFRKQGQELAPALQAFKFSTEPWTYFLDAKGVVSDRISGAFASEEIRERLQALGV